MKTQILCVAVLTSVTFALCLVSCSQPLALVAVDTLVSTQGVIMAKSVKGYYKTLSSARKTVLTHLLEYMMTSFIANFCHDSLVSLMTRIFTKTTTALFHHFPNFGLSIFSPLPMISTSLGIADAVILIRIYAWLRPSSYLEMNHEKLARKTLLCIITVASMVCMLVLKIQGHTGSIHLEKYLKKFLPDDQELSIAWLTSVLTFCYVSLFIILMCFYFFVQRRLNKKGSTNFCVRTNIRQIKPMIKDTGNDLVIEDIEEENENITIDQQTRSSVTEIAKANENSDFKVNQIPAETVETLTPKPIKKTAVQQMNPLIFIGPLVVMLLLTMNYGEGLGLIHNIRIMAPYLILVSYICTSEHILAYIERKIYQYQVRFLNRF